jgi:hypothetical protein
MIERGGQVGRKEAHKKSPAAKLMVGIAIPLLKPSKSNLPACPDRVHDATLLKAGSGAKL